jgi:uncharacterized membrane protein
MRYGGGASYSVAGMNDNNEVRRSIVTAGVVLGVGLGGFLDGIVAHQLLQWHHMLTSEGSYPATTVAGLETNTLWDGIFHAATWVLTAVGVFLLARAAAGVERFPFMALVGAMAIGWGGFNLVEGIVDHHILTIHHVRDDVDEPLPWDLGFLAFGAALVRGGWALLRASSARAAGGPAGAAPERR